MIAFSLQHSLYLWEWECVASVEFAEQANSVWTEERKYCNFELDLAFIYSFFFRAPSRYLHTDFIERDFSKHFLIFVFGLTTTAKCFSWVYLQLSVCGIVEYRRPTRSEHFQINRFTFVYIYWMKTKVAYKWRYFDPNKNRRRIEVNNWFFVLLVLRPWN